MNPVVQVCQVVDPKTSRQAERPGEKGNVVAGGQCFGGFGVFGGELGCCHAANELDWQENTEVNNVNIKTNL